MTDLDANPHNADFIQGAEPIVFLINGSGLWLPLILGFLALSVWLISRELSA